VFDPPPPGQPQVPPQWPVGSPQPTPSGFPTKFCSACGAQIDSRAEICPRCGVRQPMATAGTGKDRALAAALALLVGGLGIHKFYLGNTALGVLYLLLSWTGIPSFIGWIEGISYLLRSDAAWAAQYGGPVRRANGVAIGCLWLFALLPLLAILAVVALIFLGGQVSNILSQVGSSI
jgi:TM2 domain-containing membrane protein YozV